MKVTLWLYLLIVCNGCYNQTLRIPLTGNRGNSTGQLSENCCNNLKKCLDSIRESVINDTILFNSGDLSRKGYTYNVHPYSSLFVINNKYLYRLDIIAPPRVIEFVREYLVYDKIKRFSACDSAQSFMFWGGLANKGVVSIDLKDSVKINPQIAGLKITGKKYENNFQQGGKKELNVRY